MNAAGSAAPAGSPRVGSDRYQLDARIATGGMGEVWRATDTVLGRRVAVKVLKSEYADDATFRSRFEAEARHAAALHHPNVASIFDFGELPATDGSHTGRPFLVMELVPGQPMSALLSGGEPMPPDNAAGLVAQAADAIAAAHALGIVHRDVKPANLLVTPDGQVKITDFGIARAADAVALTQTGQVIGTPHYLAPEQAEGRTATSASDVYALGVVLYEALAGHRPFNGDSPVLTALAHLREPVPPLPGGVPDHLRAVVDRALAKDPADRFGSAADMAAALRGEPVREPTPTQVTGAPVTVPVIAGVATGATGRRGGPAPRPWLMWVAAGAAVLLVVGLVTVLAQGGPDNSAGNSAGNSANDNPAAAQGVQPEDDRVRVRRAAYIGMGHKDATASLEERGFTVTEADRDNPGGHEQDTVAAVTPSGLVDPESEISLSVWTEPPAASPPATDPEPKGDPGKEKDKGKSDNGKKHGEPKGKKQP